MQVSGIGNPLEPKWDSSSFGAARSREVSNVSSNGSIIQQTPVNGRKPLSNSASHPAPRYVPPVVSNAYVRQFPPPNSIRNFTVLREVGDGSFGTVWLADWHSELELPPGTTPPGPSNRPEYKGKKLVAIKRMKKAFEGGWEECLKLKELKSLRQIPMHANIIPLYDAFLLPSSKELYFVFECMEGNLYQLTKSRKGRPLASGLIASVFYQILAGLHHIHDSGYFHRDMKPENLLITTTGLADYPASSLYAAPTAAPEKDVVVVVKLADFGLARETNSSAAILTEYVSTRWYRAPEVLLRSRDYSNPVDMWALGTILVEVITLKPLFPGDSEVDQVYKICEVLGDPSNEYGVDERRRVKGGGPWSRGVKMAKEVGFAFPKIAPRKLASLFNATTVPSQLVDCIADLLRYEPKARLTTQECLDHPYFREVAYRFAPYDNRPPAMPTNGRAYSTQSLQSLQSLASPANQSPRILPPSHSNGTPAFHKPAFQVSGDRSRPPLPPAISSPYMNGYAQGYQPPTSEDSAMEYQENQARQQPSPSTSSIWSGNLVESQWGRTPADQRAIPAFGSHQARRGSYSGSVAASTFYDGSIFEGIAPSRASSIMSFPIGYGNQEISNGRGNYADDLTLQFERNGLSNSPPRIQSQLPSFAQQQQQQILLQQQQQQQQQLAQQQQQQQAQQVQAPIPVASGSKSRSWGFSSVFNGAGQQPTSDPIKRSDSLASVTADGKPIILDPKKAKKEAERIAKEAEKVKRDAIQMASRERARAVMRKKNQLMEAADPLNNYSNQIRLPPADKGKARASGSTTSLAISTSHSTNRMPQIIEDTSRSHASEIRNKTRRRDDDDDGHSVSSGDTGHSSQRSQRASRPFSISSQATSASETDRSSGVHRSNRTTNGLARVTSLSSIASVQSSPRHHYAPPAPNTGHSSLDHSFIDEMRQLQTSGDSGWKSPTRNNNLESFTPTTRNHLRSPSPRDPPFDTRFSPYPASRVGHNLPAIDFNGNLKRNNLHSSSASIASYHSTPTNLPSFDLPFLPSMALDEEPNPSSTFPYSNFSKT